MVALTKRQRNIIDYLTKLNESCTIKDLAHKFEVSTRSIRYDLDLIDEWLEDTGAALIRTSGKGVELYAENQQARLQLIAELRALDRGETVLSPQERKYLLFMELLQSSAAITLEKLAEKLYVSKNTVLKDLGILEQTLNSLGFRLIRRPHHGFSLEGSEKLLRKFSVDTLQKLMDMDTFTRERRMTGQVLEHPVLDFISGDELRLLDNLLGEAEKDLSTIFADDSYAILLLHLAVSLLRVRHGASIKLSPGQLDPLRTSNHFVASKKLFEQLAYTLGMNINEDEVGYFALHLSGAKVMNRPSGPSPYIENGNKERNLNLVRLMITMAEESLGVDFQQDPQLEAGLLYHLNIALQRLSNDMAISNPLTQQMRYRFPYIFEICRKIATTLEKETGLVINDDEVAYLAMHFGAAYERSMQAGFMPCALVVCSSGIATSQLLAARLKGLIPELQLVGPVSLSEVEQKLREHRINFIISTVDFESKGIETIKVNPLVDDLDLAKLKKKIFKFSSVKRLLYSSGSHAHQQEHRGGDPMLTDLLNEDQIKLGVQVGNWEEAVRSVGSILEKQGNVEPRYTQAMIDAVKTLGPYMVIMPGVALAHARPEDGVRKICMGLVTLNEPVSFGRTQNDPVKLIIGFAAVDSSTHLQALSELARVLENDENIEKIVRSTDCTEVLDIIRQYSGKEEQ